MSTTPVLSQTSFQYLLECGNPMNVHDGLITVKRRDIPSHTGDGTIDISALLNSSQTLKFCGMQTEVAEELYQRYLKEQDDVRPGELGYGDDIIEFAYAYIKSAARVDNAFWYDHDWDKALKGQGIKESVRRGILHPDYTTLRMTRSASEWAIDTLEMHWYFLTRLNRSLEMFKHLRPVSPIEAAEPSSASTSVQQSEDPSPESNEACP
jgi:hypothetical protein